MNVTSAIRVKVFPNINEGLKLVVSYPAVIFRLHIIESLECYGDEKVDEDKTHRENIENEENS